MPGFTYAEKIVYFRVLVEGEGYPRPLRRVLVLSRERTVDSRVNDDDIANRIAARVPR